MKYSFCHFFRLCLKENRTKKNFHGKAFDNCSKSSYIMIADDFQFNWI